MASAPNSKAIDSGVQGHKRKADAEQTLSIRTKKSKQDDFDDQTEANLHRPAATVEWKPFWPPLDVSCYVCKRTFDSLEAYCGHNQLFHDEYNTRYCSCQLCEVAYTGFVEPQPTSHEEFLASFFLNNFLDETEVVGKPNEAEEEICRKVLQELDELDLDALIEDLIDYEQV